jgi:chromosome segregation ATPase
MTYGYQQGGSSSSHKQALGFDAAASEQLRAKAALAERQRVERERAKQQLKDVQSKYEHNKTEISHKEVEARRLIAEITHAMHDLQEAERAVKAMEDKEHASRMQISSVGTQIQEAQKQELAKKKELEALNHEVTHIENQIIQLQQKVTEYKKQTYDLGLLIQKLTLQVKQLESEENKDQVEVSRSKSQALYKEKDLDNKKRSIQTMDQKRMREIGEIQRLKLENAHLEMEIRQLEAKAK